MSTAQSLFARHARSFAPAARLLARSDRQRVARLYALCRIVDDLADEDGSPAAYSRLLQIAADLRAPCPSEPVARAARELFEGRPAGLEAFARLVAGCREDFAPVRIGSTEALEAYCEAVAGTVGVMVCALFDVPQAHHRAAADLGCALQLVNICRDVAEDARRDRRYLPRTLCPHPPAAIVAGATPVRRDVQDTVAALLAEADSLHADASRSLPALPIRLRFAVTIAAGLYMEIGRTLQRDGGDPLAGRTVVSRPAKLRAVAQALPTVAARRSAPPTGGLRRA